MTEYPATRAYLRRRFQRGLAGPLFFVWLAVLTLMLLWLVSRGQSWFFFVFFAWFGLPAFGRWRAWVATLFARRGGARDEAAARMWEQAEEGALARRMVPEVGNALERLMTEGERVRAALEGAGKSWAELRRDAERGAEEAMGDGLMIAAPFVRQHGQRKADFAQWATGERVMDAVARLDALRHKVARLAVGLASVSQQAEGSALDRALHELESVRSAEQELDETPLNERARF